MALVFVDGFDHYNIADLLKKWSAQGPGSNSSLSMDTGRISGQSLKITNAASNSHCISPAYTFPAIGTTGGIGFAFKTSFYSSAGSQARVITSLYDGLYEYAQLFLTLNGD